MSWALLSTAVSLSITWPWFATRWTSVTGTRPLVEMVVAVKRRRYMYLSVQKIVLPHGGVPSLITSLSQLTKLSTLSLSTIQRAMRITITGSWSFAMTENVVVMVIQSTSSCVVTFGDGVMPTTMRLISPMKVMATGMISREIWKVLRSIWQWSIVVEKFMSQPSLHARMVLYIKRCIISHVMPTTISEHSWLAKVLISR